MHERMRLDAVGRDAHFIAGKASCARANKWVEHPEFDCLAFGQQPFHPFCRKACAVTKPPVYRQPHIVEEVGRVAHHLQCGTNLFALLVGLKQVEDGLFVVLAQTQQHGVALLGCWIFGWRCHFRAQLTPPRRKNTRRTPA